MIRHRSADRCGALESGLVAAITVSGAERVIVIYVAGSAGRGRRRHVRAGQSKTGYAVIEGSGVPALSRMAS